jgi:hypothetical protein
MLLALVPLIAKDAYSHPASAGTPVGSALDHIVWMGFFAGTLGLLSVVILKSRQEAGAILSDRAGNSKRSFTVIQVPISNGKNAKVPSKKLLYL